LAQRIQGEAVRGATRRRHEGLPGHARRTVPAGADGTPLGQGAAKEVTARRYIGQSIKRLEDRPLLTGYGRFVADLRFPEMLEAAFLRSPHGHARIRPIDATTARRAPGVHAVFTLADLKPLLAQERLPLQFRTAQLPPDITPLVLAKDEVAFVGEAVE